MVISIVEERVVVTKRLALVEEVGKRKAEARKGFGRS
jgi:hypothetical protein